MTAKITKTTRSLSTPKDGVEGANGMKARSFDPNAMPKALGTDSYKQSHTEAYPECEAAGAYAEARKGFLGDKHDKRLVVNGVRYFVERYLMRRWTEEDVEEAKAVMDTFGVGNTPHPFPEDLFRKVVKPKSEGGNDGYFPVRVRALRDGQAILARTPMLVLEAEEEYSRLVTWIETLGLETLWYMSTVATLSRRVRDSIDRAFDESVDEDFYFLKESRLHDFGMRGCTSIEQSIKGGSSHLLSFDGSDTLSAVWYVRNHIGDKHVGSSIPASEHSLMMSFDTELEAVEKMIDLYGGGLFATVADTYDYEAFLNDILPQVAERVREKGGFHVVRPDSGDPVECVVQGLKALERAYGADVNGKGYKVIRGAGIIQGDGIDAKVLEEILEAVLASGYSAQNVAFGMGGGLLQKVDRNTLSFACKLSYRIVNGKEEAQMKDPITDPNKRSFPGRLAVVNQGGALRGMPYDALESAGRLDEDALEVVYDSGPTDYEFESFTEARERLRASWDELAPLKAELGISAELQEKMDRQSRLNRT